MLVLNSITDITKKSTCDFSCSLDTNSCELTCQTKPLNSEKNKAASQFFKIMLYPLFCSYILSWRQKTAVTDITCFLLRTLYCEMCFTQIKFWANLAFLYQISLSNNVNTPTSLTVEYTLAYLQGAFSRVWLLPPVAAFLTSEKA